MYATKSTGVMGGGSKVFFQEISISKESIKPSKYHFYSSHHVEELPLPIIPL